MKRSARTAAACAVALALAAPGAPATGAVRTPSSPLDHLDMAYVEEITTHLTEIGSVPDGFRVFGTPQDEETAQYLADQMHAIGLEDVATEEVTGDAWLFEGASADVHGSGIDRTFRAASLGGVPGTGPSGVRGRVVNVGYGTAPEYEGLDVRGKIVFAWWDFDNRGIWPNLIAEEAKAHGAEAAIIASGPGHVWYAAGGGRALGSNDGECGLRACAPTITISKRHARALVRAMDRGPVRARVTLRATNTLDATGYQPIGQIRGWGDPDRVIVFTAHHDAWFTSAGDDSVGVAMMLALAKAVTDSGYRPYYTWVFAPVTGEEYGLADAYADWLQGAWWRMTRSHPDWATDAVAVLNWEVHSPPYLVDAATSYEIADAVGASLDRSVSDGLIEDYGIHDVFSWNDGFVYQARGAPSVTFGATGDDYWARYHTDYDDLASLDFASLAPVLEAEAGVAFDLDRATIPYGLDGRLETLAASLDGDVMRAFGADAAGIQAAYDDLSDAWAEAEGVPASPCAMAATRSAVTIIEDRLTALYLTEGTSYPHEQPQLDLVLLSAGLDELRAGHPNRALRQLFWVSLNSSIFDSSRRPYLRQILIRSPGYPKLSWAVEGQYPLLLDMYDTLHRIAAKSTRPHADYDAQIARIERLIAKQSTVYRLRIRQMTRAMEAAADPLRRVAGCAAP